MRGVNKCYTLILVINRICVSVRLYVPKKKKIKKKNTGYNYIFRDYILYFEYKKNQMGNPETLATQETERRELINWCLTPT
jgi:hypothetical protein